MHHRYAIYFCPKPHSPWWERGSQWLGRCALSQRAKSMPAVDGMDEAEFLQLTSEPRRYGWHATLKAPFTLATDQTETHLRASVQALAQRFRVFDMPALHVRNLGNFLALVPADHSTRLDEVARACVTELQSLAAPLSDAELARRRKSPLSPAEDALLVQWGYPYVLDAFRFHCSLTGGLGALSGEQTAHVALAATHWFSGLPALRFESLVLVAEPTPGADFVVLEHLDLLA